MRCVKKNLKAFSIPEVLLSVFVLSIGLVTIVNVMIGSLNYSLKDRETIVATGLAQEGVELVRNVRDNDLALGGTGFDAFSNSRRHCRIDWDDDNDSLTCYNTPGGSGSRYVLQYSGGRYAHGGALAGAGKFSRYVYIDYDSSGSGERARVRSFVYWGGFDVDDIDNGSANRCVVTRNATNGSVSGCVSAEAFLTAWR